MKRIGMAVMAAIILMSAPGVYASGQSDISTASVLTKKNDSSLHVVEITPGELISILPGRLTDGQSSLSICGEADIRDLKTFQSILPPTVKTLDLSELRIVAYSYPRNSEGNGAFYPADHLPEWTFFKSGIENLLLPQGLKSIGKGAFSSSALRKIDIPAGVEEIGDYAFYASSALEEVIFPESLRSLGKSAFGNCISLKSADLSSSGITYLQDMCFSGCSQLSSIELPVSLRRVGGRVLRGTLVQRLSLTQVKAFEDYALYGLPLLSRISFSPTAEFGRGVLMNDTSLTSVIGFPDIIPPLFMAECPSLDIDGISSDIVEIGAWAFAGGKACKINLSAVNLLREGAFSDIGGLESIDVRKLGGNIPQVEDNTFKCIDPFRIKLIVSGDSEVQWRSHPVWGEFDIVADYIVDSSIVANFDDIQETEISVVGHSLHISSSSPLSSISIYTHDGMLLLSKQLVGNIVDIELPSSAPAYMVVVVNSECGMTARKISVTSNM